MFRLHLNFSKIQLQVTSTIIATMWKLLDLAVQILSPTFHKTKSGVKSLGSGLLYSAAWCCCVNEEPGFLVSSNTLLTLSDDHSPESLAILYPPSVTITPPESLAMLYSPSVMMTSSSPSSIISKGSESVVLWYCLGTAWGPPSAAVWSWPPSCARSRVSVITA